MEKKNREEKQEIGFITLQNILLEMTFIPDSWQHFHDLGPRLESPCLNKAKVGNFNSCTFQLLFIII